VQGHQLKLKGKNYLETEEIVLQWLTKSTAIDDIALL